MLVRELELLPALDSRELFPGSTTTTMRGRRRLNGMITMMSPLRRLLLPRLRHLRPLRLLALRPSSPSL